LFSDPIDFDKAQAVSFPPVSARDYLPLRKAICPPTHFDNEDKQQFYQMTTIMPSETDVKNPQNESTLRINCH